MNTGKHLKIVSMGDSVLGVKLEGNPQKPEPIHFRATFPGGDVDIVRTTDNKYWIHVRVNNKLASSYNPVEPTARIINARLDQSDKHSIDSNVGDFNRPELYHMAVLVETI